MSAFQAAKLQVLSIFPFSRDIAHATVGLLLLLLVLLLRRKSALRWTFILPTVAAALLGEALDAFDSIATGMSGWLRPALSDIVFTVLPAAPLLVLLILVRTRSHKSDYLNSA